MSYDDGTLTANCPEASLGSVLLQLSDIADFSLHNFAVTNTPVELQVEQRPIQAMLKELLRGYSLAYKTTRSAGGTIEIEELFIFAPSDPDSGTPRIVIREPVLQAVPEGKPELPEGLNSADPAIRAGSLETTYSMNHQHAIEILRDKIKNDPHSQVRERALFILKQIGGDGAYETIAFALGDEESTNRIAALQALNDLDEERAKPQLGQILLGDSDPAARMQALRLLAQDKDEVSLALIQAGINDSDEDVRALAEKLLR